MKGDKRSEKMVGERAGEEFLIGKCREKESGEELKRGGKQMESRNWIKRRGTRERKCRHLERSLNRIKDWEGKVNRKKKTSNFEK